MIFSFSPRKTLCACLCAAALGLGTVAQAVTPQEALQHTDSWMQYLPDNMFVAHVSIPGTHDTMTGHGFSGGLGGASDSQTQEVTLDYQLNNGVRAFDFRPGLVKSGSSYYLNCNHGVSNTKVTMEEAFTTLHDFLEAHPGEFFVMHLFRGNVYSKDGDANSTAKFFGAAYDDSASREMYNSLMNDLFNQGKFADMFVDYKPTLTVGEARGKIVVFRRDRIDFAHVAKAGNLTNWPADDAVFDPAQVVGVTHASDASVRGVIHATDISSPGNEEVLQRKRDAVKAAYDNHRKSPRPADAIAANPRYKPDWTMIFTSGEALGSGRSAYLKCAQNLNPLFTSIINETPDGERGPIGIVFSDWVLVDSYSSTSGLGGIDLIPAIIGNNFYYVDDYTFDTSLMDTGADSMWGKEKNYVLRNVGTGKFLSAGANWGTHATAGDIPIRVALRPSDTAGCYNIETTFVQGGGPNYYGSNNYIDNEKAFDIEFVAQPGGYFVLKCPDGNVLTAVSCSGFADGSQYTIEQVAANPGDAMQQWEVLTVQELLDRHTAMATPDSPQNVSYMIRGNSFHPNDDVENNAVAADQPGWHITAKSDVTYGTAFNKENDWTDKRKVMRFYSAKKYTASTNTNWEAKQEVTGLPNGKYRVELDYFNFAGSNITSKVNDTVIESTGSCYGSSGNISAADILTQFDKGVAGGGHISVEIVVTTGSVTFDFNKSSKTKSETTVAFTNLRMWYMGPENMTSVTYAPAEGFDTFVLPFDAEKPAGMNLYKAEFLESTAPTHAVVDLVAAEEIRAGQPYVVNREGAAVSYKFWGVPVDGLTCAGNLLTGVLADTDVAAADDVRVLDKCDGTAAFVPVSGASARVNANRAYMRSQSPYVFFAPIDAVEVAGEYDAATRTLMLTATPGDATVTYAVTTDGSQPELLQTIYTEDGIDLSGYEGETVTVWARGRAQGYAPSLPAEVLKQFVNDEAMSQLVFSPVVAQSQLVAGNWYIIVAEHVTDGHHALGHGLKGEKVTVNHEGQIAANEADFAHVHEFELFGTDGDYNLVAKTGTPLHDMLGAGAISVKAVANGAGINIDVTAPQAVTIAMPTGNLGFNSDAKDFGVSDAHSSPLMLYTTGSNMNTGIEDVIDDACEAVYYNLQGIKVATPARGNVYIVRRGATTTKELIR